MTSIRLASITWAEAFQVPPAPDSKASQQSAPDRADSRGITFVFEASGMVWNCQHFIELAVCKNLVPLVNIKIAGKWMFIPLKMVLIGIDPYPINIFQKTWRIETFLENT
jgi:hypothetical protein